MGDLYVCLDGVYLHIFSSTKAPHQLPHYAPDHLMMLVAYQTYIGGFAVAMLRKKKIL